MAEEKTYDLAVKELVFICAWNEEGSIGEVICELKAALPGVDILVVDDGSSDQTAEIASRLGAQVHSFGENQGLEKAISEGYRQAFEGGYELCGRVDADGQHDAYDLARMMALVRSGECDVAVGSRFLPGSGHYQPTPERVVGTSLLRLLLTLKLGTPISDGTSGMYAVNRFAMRLLAIPYEVGSPEVQGLMRLSDAELKIREVPVSMRERSHGSSSFVGSRAFKLVITVTGALLLGEAYRRRRRNRY